MHPSHFQFALLDLDPRCELPGSWWQFMMGEAACFPTHIRAVCQQLSSVTSHLLLPASLSLLSITFFSLFHTGLANKSHTYAQVSYKLCASRYKITVGRGKSSSKAHVVVRCLHSPQLNAVPNFLIPPWRKAPFLFLSASFSFCISISSEDIFRGELQYQSPLGYFWGKYVWTQLHLL